MTDTNSSQYRDKNDPTTRVLAAASVGFVTSEFAHLTSSDVVQAMSEERWLGCMDPLAMLCFLHGRASGRKFRLFTVGCARDLLAQGKDERTAYSGRADVDAGDPAPLCGRFETAILEAEAWADGKGTLGDTMGWLVNLSVCDVISDEDVAHAALGFDADVGLWLAPIEQVVPRMIGQYCTHPAHYIRDIFGSVFHGEIPNPPSRNATIRALAEQVYQDRLLPIGHFRLDRLSMLVAALEEAGCTDAALLEHLRAPGPHVRGCWALDLVLSNR